MTETVIKSGYAPLVATTGVTVTFGVTFTVDSDSTGDYTPSIFGWKTDLTVPWGRRFIDVGVFKSPVSMVLKPAENDTNINWSVVGNVSVTPVGIVSETGGITSAQLIDELAGVQTIGAEKVTFTKSQVLFAGTQAQNDILTRLKLIDDTVRLALAPNQETYTFPPSTPTGASTASNGEVILTITAHVFHEGDDVVVSGTTGGGDGRWLITVPDANSIQLTGSVASSPAVYAASRVYHALMAAIEIKEQIPIRKVSNASGFLTGYIMKKSRMEFEKFRDEFGNTSVSEESVVNFLIHDNTPCIELHFQGVPNEAILVDVEIARKPLPCERLTETVDPIIPFGYEELFILATRAFLFKSRYEGVFMGTMYGQRYIPGIKDQVWNDYQKRLAEVDAAVTARRVVYQTAQPGEGW